MCQTEKETMEISPICGPLDSSFSKSSTGIILITQMVVALVAFFSVQFSAWCLESVGAIRTFTTLSLFVFWLNMIFFVIFICNLPYKIGNVNWLLLTFLQQLFGSFFMLVAVIVLGINPCSVGQIIGEIIGIVLFIFYLLGSVLVYRNYLKPDRSLEPMDPRNAELPDVARVTDLVRAKVEELEDGVNGQPRPPTPPGPYLAPTTFYAPPHPPPPTFRVPPPPPQRTYLSSESHHNI